MNTNTYAYRHREQKFQTFISGFLKEKKTTNTSGLDFLCYVSNTGTFGHEILAFMAVLKSPIFDPAQSHKSSFLKKK